MNDKVGPSCWGLTTKVMLAVACVMILTWLAGAPEGAAVLASG